MRELIRDLALTLRERVLPHLGSHAARAHEAAAAGGDVTLGSTHEFQMSVVAAANERLHGAILEAVDAGFARVSG